MQNRILVQSLFLFLATICLTLALQVTNESTGRVYRSSATSRNGQVLRERRATTTPKPGFFRTLFSVIYEQYSDTREVIGNVSKSINDNFLPENETVKPTPAPGTNVTTTEDNRISRAEFNKIILRNLRGLQRLFQIELKEAMQQSEKNYEDFRKNVSVEVGKFL